MAFPVALALLVQDVIAFRRLTCMVADLHRFVSSETASAAQRVWRVGLGDETWVERQSAKAPFREAPVVVQAIYGDPLAGYRVAWGAVQLDSLIIAAIIVCGSIQMSR